MAANMDYSAPQSTYSPTNVGSVMLEYAKGLTGASHSFFFRNTSDHYVKMLVSEDPERLVPEAAAGVRLSGHQNIPMGIALGVHGEMRHGLREPEEVVLIPNMAEPREVRASSTCFWVFAAAADPEIRNYYKVFWQNRRVEMGTTMNILPRHVTDIGGTWQMASSLKALQLMQRGEALPQHMAQHPHLEQGVPALGILAAPVGLDGVLGRSSFIINPTGQNANSESLKVSFGTIDLSSPVLVWSSTLRSWIPCKVRAVATSRGETTLGEPVVPGSVRVQFDREGRLFEKWIHPDDLAKTLKAQP